MLTRIVLAFILAISAIGIQSFVSPSTDAEASSHESTVVVEAGDTLGQIASEHGVSVQALVALNQIDDPNVLHPGQVLQIPANSSGVGGQGAQQVPAPRGAPVWESQWVEVDLTNQVFRAWEGDEVVRAGLISSGRPAVPTLTGTFETYVHLVEDDMSGWTPDRGSYDVRGVPYVMYYDGGYGLHGTYWHNNFGTPQSAGCVNMTVEDARWVFNWAGGAGTAGLTVHIHGTTPGM